MRGVAVWAAVTLASGVAALASWGPPKSAGLDLHVGDLPTRSAQGWHAVVVMDVPQFRRLACGYKQVAVRVGFEAPASFRQDYAAAFAAGRPVRFAVVLSGAGRRPRVTAVTPHGTAETLRVRPVGNSHSDIAVAGGDLRRYIRPGKPASFALVFVASWITRRTLGSCWVKVPHLTDGADATLTYGALRGAMAFREAVPRKAVTSGSVAFRGTLPSADLSEPAPNAGPLAWACAVPQRGFTSTCGGQAVITSPWLDRVHDAMLLLCGLALALTAERYTRWRSRARTRDAGRRASSRDGRAGRHLALGTKASSDTAYRRAPNSASPKSATTRRRTGEPPLG